MTYKVIITESAYRDLESIKIYINLDNEEKAKCYIEKMFLRLESLDLFPDRGIKINNSIFNYTGAYYLTCLNHVAIYQINEIARCVYILRVLSHFQYWKNIVNKDLLNKFDVIASDDEILLSRINASMYYDFYRNSLDENNKKYVPDEVFETLEEASEVVNQIIDNYQSNDGPFVYAIIRKKDNFHIGYVQLAKLDEGWEIGYHIANMFAGNGYASKAVQLFINYLKENTNIKEIYGISLSINKASKRVLEKCGFELIYEGNGIYQGHKRKIIKAIKRL